MSMPDYAAVPEADRNEVVCPRERSSMTPCVARDGHTAKSDDYRCVGCGLPLDDMLDDYAQVVRRYVALKGNQP
jgi:hypothetical protein